MKKLLAVAAAIILPAFALAAAATYTVYAGNTTVKIVCASGTCDAPTALSQFVKMDNWQGFSVTVEADANQTLSGAGTISCYVWDPSTFNKPSFLQDLGLAASTSGKISVTLQGVFVAAPRGYVTCVPTGVTVSSGGVTLYVNAATRHQ